MLDRKVAIVTGGSEGIGFGIASALASRGDLVYLVARTRDKLDKAKRKIEEHGGMAEIKQADITDLAQMKHVIESVYDQNNRLDIFVNNAGAWEYQTLGAPIEELRRMRILTGVAPGEIVEHLVDRFKNSGHELKILTVVSQAGLRYFPGNLGYGLGKKSLTLHLLELQGEIESSGIGNVKLYGLYPATVATESAMPMIKSGRLQDATSLESVVQTSMDLLSDRTPSRHAYVGYIPGKGIVRKYLDVNPTDFQVFPQLGEDYVVDPDFTPKNLFKE